MRDPLELVTDLGLDQAPPSLRHAFEMATVTAMILPVVYLWAGKVGLQVSPDPSAYLLRTSLLIALGLLVVAALFVPLIYRRNLLGRYAFGFLVLFYAGGAFKAAFDLVLDVAAGPRTLVGAPGAPTAAWLPVWLVDLMAVFLHVIVLYWLTRPDAAGHVLSDADPSSSTPSRAA